jgi:hypothetical protein
MPSGFGRRTAVGARLTQTRRNWGSVTSDRPFRMEEPEATYCEPSEPPKVEHLSMPMVAMVAIDLLDMAVLVDTRPLSVPLITDYLAVISSTAAISSAVSCQPSAPAFCRTCSGVVVPAMTLAT